MCALPQETRASSPTLQSRTAYQIADRNLFAHLQATHADWETYRDLAKRDSALQKFRDDLYRWY